jgi:tRNA(adenine34) deaminase
MSDAGAGDAEAVRFMRSALQEAHAAREAGEVPVGAVVVRDGKVIASGRNRSIGDCDPTAHAEVVALRAAAQAVGNYRLEDCDLYVTLEPCPMCSGAMLHARLRRVIYGARDPRTGSAGSVFDLFSMPQLNHQSGIQGGIIATECGALLQDFFREKRRAALRRTPLREDSLRTPEEAFAGVPTAHGAPSQYWQDDAALEGLRMHYRDSGPDAAGEGASQESAAAWLFLHGPNHWSQRFDAALDRMAAAGVRAVAPDLIGFGRSDKPKREAFHAAAWHAASLHALVRRLDLQRIVVVVEEGSRLLADRLIAMEPMRYRGLAVLQGPEAERVAVDAWHSHAPYPDRGHRAGPRAFANGFEQDGRMDGAVAPLGRFPILPLPIDQERPDIDRAWLSQAMKYFAP